MRAGELRHRVTIQANTPAISSTGDPVASWAAITNGTVYASIDTVSGSERLVSDQMGAQLTHRVTMRYRPDLAVTAKHRLLWGTRVLNITMVDDSRKHAGERTLLCSEEA